MKLLDKAREINGLLQQAGGQPVDFEEIAGILSRAIDGTVLIINKEGQILGCGRPQEYDCEYIRSALVEGEVVSQEFSKWVDDFERTEANYELHNGECTFLSEVDCSFTDRLLTVIPILSGGDRLGTVLLTRFEESFTDEELILGEYGATVIGMEILRSQSSRVEENARRKAAVKIALDTLSYSEMEAIEYIFDELDGDEGLLVASKIADSVGITRSVIVNALRKFESAGVIETRSLGMKGTYIRVLNDQLTGELDKLRD